MIQLQRAYAELAYTHRNEKHHNKSVVMMLLYQDKHKSLEMRI